MMQDSNSAASNHRARSSNKPSKSLLSEVLEVGFGGGGCLYEKVQRGGRAVLLDLSVGLSLSSQLTRMTSGEGNTNSLHLHLEELKFENQ